MPAFSAWIQPSWLLWVAVCATNLVTTLAAETRPNILIIFTDDQGYADLSCTGSAKNHTPRLDQLAREGTRFTNFYSQDVCGPSRSALLTGRYPIRSQGWNMPAEEITFAELLRGVGYQTACIGKWDVSNRQPIAERMPLAQGFDSYFGPLGANDGGEVRFHQDNDPAGTTRDMGSLIELYTDKAIDYLRAGRQPDRPFVLYLAHTMMHTIIDASPKFKGTTSSLYGDVVAEFDFHTGRLLDTLQELGLSENTLVIYTSDNGPWNQPAYTDTKKGHPDGSVFWGEAGPLRNGKGSCYEAGSRVPCIVRWPGKVPAGRVSPAIFATIDFLPTFAKLSGFEVPQDRLIDGVDQTDLLLGTSDQGARDSFFYQGNGVRQGKWKYLKAKHQVPGYAQDKQRAEVEELYDLEADVGETRNLAAEYPERVEQLKQLMQQIQGSDQHWGGIGLAVYDDFSSSVHKSRLAERGDWKFADGVAECTADPQLYAQFNNHGPILRWPHKFNKARIEFEFKAKDAERLVFTLNNAGHVFRVVLADEPRTRVLAWPTDSSSSKPEILIKAGQSTLKGLPTLSSLEDQWTKLQLDIRGPQATLRIGEEQWELDHPALGREKTELTLSFAMGKLSVRQVRLTAKP